MYAHYLPNVLKFFESTKNPYNPFHYLNSAVDMMFYDVSTLSFAELNQAVWDPQLEGSILIMRPGKAQSGYAVCVPQDTGLSPAQRAEAVIGQFDHYLATHPGLCVDTIAIAGCGSSTVGAAAFGKAVAEILRKPVATIVTGGGLGDAKGEVLGGMMLGAMSQFLHAVDAVVHSEMRNASRRDWMREELEGFLQGMPEAETLRMLLAREIFGECTTEGTALQCREKQACGLKTIVSHSKGDWVVWGALLGIEFLANRPGTSVSVPADDKKPHIDVVTFGCIVDLPEMPGNEKLQGIFHYHQYVGLLDTMLGLTQSPYQKSFELLWKGIFDGFEPAYLSAPDECLIPLAGHNLASFNPTHMPIEKLLPNCAA